MRTQERSLGRPLAAETLREIERALEGRLRAHHISEAFIARCEEDSIQKGFAEYLRALEEGREIVNRDAFIVDVAFKRAVDEIRAEVRHGDPATLAAIADGGAGTATAAGELATDRVFAAELHDAIGSLPPDKRQVVSLYYFEQKTIRECAEALFVSETSLRRALGAAVATLRRRLGVEIPDRDDRLGIEIGLAAWVLTRGAQTPPAGDLADRVLAMLAQLRRTISAGFEKLRELTWRPPPAAGEEGIRTLVASPFGRVAGACVGAAVCALGGAAIWSGASHPQPRPPHASTGIAPAHRVAEAPTRPPDQPVVRPLPSHHRESVPSASTTTRRAEGSAGRSAGGSSAAETRVAPAHRAHRSSREAEEAEQVRAQTSGIARVESESTSSSPSAEPTGSSVPEISEPAAVSPSSSLSSPQAQTGSRSSGEARAEEEFGAFK